MDSPKQSTPIVILSVAKYPNKINLRVAQQIKSFCYFWLSPKVESPYSLVIARFGKAESKQNKRSAVSLVIQTNQYNGAK